MKSQSFLGMVRFQKEMLRKQLEIAEGKKLPVSVSLFLEIDNLEIEHELACAATRFWAQAMWAGQWDEHVTEAWTRQVWGSCFVEIGQRLCRSVFLFCEMKGLGRTLPSWQV